MSRSQNGWLVIEPSEVEKKTREWTIPDSPAATMRLLPGPYGFVLAHFTLWYIRNIEEITDLPLYDDHGYGYRQISGSNTWSNHASATAIDLNANKHPQGGAQFAGYTFSQTNDIQDALERRYRNTIKWGAMFRTSFDPMHYEYIVGKILVAELASDLFDTPNGIRLREANPWLKWEPTAA